MHHQELFNSLPKTLNNTGRGELPATLFDYQTVWRDEARGSRRQDHIGYQHVGRRRDEL
jgi:hypothetical protein